MDATDGSHQWNGGRVESGKRYCTSQTQVVGEDKKGSLQRWCGPGMLWSSGNSVENFLSYCHCIIVVIGVVAEFSIPLSP